ncbi:hypothetical protein J2Z35_000916 [Acetoanaerobium pronyense]|uniref:Fibronectin type-III domain-containing protein n=1 Tax=Acetoanaerobium pronyense TaxID=1482736 RepID=A0ABS4KH65_9FIRM|nr:IPT/TIG domain-containing protein [Acetoanaerobium pronyense]MBP2027122.1 hypothetical protein [Acetoanaerobium pronyense]
MITRKRTLSIITAFMMLFIGIPFEAFAATPISITEFNFVQESVSGNTSVKVFITGGNLDTVDNIIINNGISPVAVSAMPGATMTKTRSLITITAPLNAPNPPATDYTALNFNLNGNTTITLESPSESKAFTVNVNNLPSMDSLTQRKIYVGDQLTLNGRDFTGVTEVAIANAGHSVSETPAEITVNPTSIVIPSIKRGTLNAQSDIILKKQNSTTVDGQPVPVTFSVVYKNSVTVLQKIEGLENLRVVPSQGPPNRSNLINVAALDTDLTTILKNKFNDNMDIYLRNSEDETKEIKLLNPRLRRDGPNNTGDVIGLEAFTVANSPFNLINVPMHVVIRDRNNPAAEAIALNAFRFTEGSNVLTVAGAVPGRAKDNVPTDITILGRNIININTPDIVRPTGAVITPASTPPANPTREGNTLNIKYSVGGNPTYGGKIISEIERNIEAIVGLKTVPLDVEIDVTKPSTDNYGLKHFTTPSEDGLVVKTQSLTADKPRYDITVDTETIITLEDGTKISIFESATLSGGFIFDPAEIRPVITGVEPVYGYFHKVDTVTKPLMIRIKGSNLQAIRVDDPANPGQRITKYPQVNFYTPGGQLIGEVQLSNLQGDKKILSNGLPIDGEFSTLGDTYVIAIEPATGSELKERIKNEPLDPAGFHKLFGFIEVINPEGGRNLYNIDSPRFEFRYPSGEESPTEGHPKQPFINEVLHKGAPATTLSSDEENEIEIKFTANTGITNLNTVRVTLDGMDVTSRITNRAFQGDNAVIKLKTPKGIAGETRLQVIITEGLMDSYDLRFAPITGPVLKELIPDSGDPGTIVVIKRNNQANNVRFIRPNLTSDNELLQIGTKVLLNGQDVNEYFRDTNDDIEHQDSDIFFDSSNPENRPKLPGKYVYVVDADTIIVKIPESKLPGNYNLQVRNPDLSESLGLQFRIIDTGGSKTEINTIDPNRGDIKGGIISTITAGGNTTFRGEVDVFFGSQKGQVVGYSLDFKEAYVQVPPLVDSVITPGQSYTVPVTVKNKVNQSTGTKLDGFTYFNPAYDIRINSIYRQGLPSNDPNANKGNVGDLVWIEGDNFRAKKEADEVINIPSIYFGYKKATEIINYDIIEEGQDGTVKLSRILVRVPEKPINVAEDGSVDLMVINEDGATAIRQKGFIYSSGNPEIIQNSSILSASRFTDTINVSARDINSNGLIVAFGNKSYKTDLGDLGADLETINEIEKLHIRYRPGAGNNIEVFYKAPDGTLTLMADAENTTGGRFRIGAVGEKTVIGINWRNPEYHKATNLANNVALLSRLNKEYVSIGIERSGNINQLVVRRGLGKVEKVDLNETTRVSNIRINTPYNDRIETTTITLINQDGSSASAPFNFTGGLTAPVITDIEGSKDRQVRIGGSDIDAKVYSHDFNATGGVVKILGSNMAGIKSVRIGDKEAKIEAVSPDNDFVIVSIPKGTAPEVRVPQVVSISTGEGNAFSDSATPPVYFMYIAAESKPVIDTITPDKGPRTGGTFIRVTGSGFRETDEFGIEDRITVNLNGSPAALRNIEKNGNGEITAINITAPQSVAGAGKLQVINADGGASDEKPFTYISQPKISESEGAIFFNDTQTEVKIIGEDFRAGAKVIIGGELIKSRTAPDGAKASGILGVTAGINQDAHVTGGVEAAAVTVEGTTTIKFKMPEGVLSLENTSIIIVNPDGGISDPGEGNVKPPVPDVPDIEAIPGFERSMILRWNIDKDVLNAAEKFEIYAREDRSSTDYVFVGDTKGTEFVVRGLKPDTRYQFNVRVLNKFGQANDVGYVRATTLRERDDYKEKDKIIEAENTVREIQTQGKQEVVGNTLQYTVGTSENFINLANFNQNEKYIQIPARDIKRGVKTLTISDRGMTMNIPYSSLNVSQITSASDDAFFRIKLTSVNNQMQESIGALVPRNMSRNSRVYSIDFEVVDKRLTSPVFSLNGMSSMSITPDRGTSLNNTIYRYNESGHNLLPVGVGTIQLREAGHYLLLSPR